MAGYLLDTNIISETRKIRANEGIINFLSNAEEGSLFLSVLTLAELRKGVKMKHKTDPAVAAQLDTWVNGIEITFSSRVLVIDIPIARLWAELSAVRDLPVIDTLIAATAIVKGLILVTRNSKDIKSTGVTFIDPGKNL
jgi:toxin FitB